MRLFFVAPDYLAVGTDEDYLLTPMTPMIAQRIADRLGCTLPTRKMVDDIYAACQRLKDHGVTINRPPRDGHMAFVRSPDQISVEILQRGAALPPREPWVSMPNVGSW